MNASIIIPEVREGTERDVKVDASKVPDVEWNCLCAVLLPLIRDFYELDEKVEAD